MNMIIVEVNPKRGIDAAIKTLRKKVKDTKQVQKLRKNQAYEKPSVNKRQVMKSAKYAQKLKNNP
jgi:small subunit ribosomal protein S21